MYNTGYSIAVGKFYFRVEWISVSVRDNLALS